MVKLEVVDISVKYVIYVLWIKKQPEFMSNGFINKKGLKTLREYKYENMG